MNRILQREKVPRTELVMGFSECSRIEVKSIRKPVSSQWCQYFKKKKKRNMIIESVFQRNNVTDKRCQLTLIISVFHNPRQLLKRQKLVLDL